ncbi:hypothetical protein IGI04_033046 [Brassica rapa subsp. trilocularis]|uniref:Uncharacterized protein n=1 Tax=Brassica rapa subsp. trilocularis TaxID=1813537 RepID=A0ABQ7L8L9_BRACM|nr:hypothetical protein IGI04_033046 [Brassica rapa subsp. trilocularis]
MGDTMGHKHQLQKSVPVKNHNHLGSGGLRRPGAPPLRDLNYNTRQMQQNNWQMSKGEDRMPAFSLGRASSGTGVYFPRIASHPPTKKTEIREDDSKTKEKKSETVETPFDSLEKLLPEEWTY